MQQCCFVNIISINPLYSIYKICSPQKRRSTVTCTLTKLIINVIVNIAYAMGQKYQIKQKTIETAI